MIKKYNIPIYRKLSSSEVVKETPENSYFNLKVSVQEKIDVNESFETKIYSVERSESQLIICSNTLNIKVTDIFSDLGSPLYYFKEFNIDEEELENKDKIISALVSEYTEGLTEYRLDPLTDILYFNKDLDILKEDCRYLFNIGNPANRTHNVKVRKLKNRFKITIKDINGLIADIKLPAKFLFEPIVYKDFKEIPESIFVINNKQYYIYNNSFNILDKTEYNELNEVKDPVIYFINSSDYFLHYTSWRSNLLFDEKLKTKYYYYLKLNSPNDTDLIEQSLYEINTSDVLFMFSSEGAIIENNVTINPFTEIEIKKPLGENFSLVYEEYKDSHYNTYNDIKFGTEKLELNFENIYTNKSIYLLDNEGIIYQSDKLILQDEYSSKDTEDLPDKFINNLTSLKNKINDILANQLISLDNKIYTNR